MSPESGDQEIDGADRRQPRNTTCPSDRDGSVNHADERSDQIGEEHARETAGGGCPQAVQDPESGNDPGTKQNLERSAGESRD